MCLAVPLRLIEINGKDAVGEAMGMSLVQTETFSGEEKIAGGQIKIFIVD